MTPDRQRTYADDICARAGEGIAVMHALAVDAPGEAASLAATSITSWTVAFAATTFVSNFWAVAMIGYRY